MKHFSTAPLMCTLASALFKVFFSFQLSSNIKPTVWAFTNFILFSLYLTGAPESHAFMLVLRVTTFSPRYDQAVSIAIAMNY